MTEYKRGDNSSPRITTLSLSSCLLRWVVQSTAGCLVLIAMLLAVTACGNEPITTLTPTPEITKLTALLFGELVEVEGCLRVNEDYGGTSYLLAWPPDFVVSVKEDTVHLIDGDSNEVTLHIGEIVRISGGMLRSIEYLDERVRRKLPANCPGPYWVVGSEINSMDAEEKSK